MPQALPCVPDENRLFRGWLKEKVHLLEEPKWDVLERMAMRPGAWVLKALKEAQVREPVVPK